MSTLILRLAGPMQSWGTQSRFTERDTGREPSRSGVLGMICAAMGLPRDCDLSIFGNLRMGVRVDQEGEVQRDFHTTKDIIKAKGKDLESSISNRYYLSDAVFLVALEGEDNQLLRKIHEALKNPAWQLFLGRKAFVPSLPVWIYDGFRAEESIEQVFESYPSYITKHIEEMNESMSLRCVVETNYEEREATRQDVPLSFESDRRQFSLRYVKSYFIELPAEKIKEVRLCSCHD